MQVIEEECPGPKPGEVRVKVLASGVSLPDVLAREGIHPETPRVPIEYRNSDFVQEIQSFAGDGVDAVFDGIGGDNV